MRVTRCGLNFCHDLAKEYNPQIINALSDLAATAGEDYEFLSMHARKKFDKMAVI